MMPLIFNNLPWIVFVAGLSFLIAVYYFSSTVQWHAMNVWYSIWRMNKLSNDATPDQGDNQGWLVSEKTLCQDYGRFISIKDKEDFDKRIDFLSLAGDRDSRPMPIGMLLLEIILIAAEGLGFSYMLGTWLAMEGSQSTFNLLMVAIVFVLCTMLLMLNHAAGKQFKRSQAINHADKKWRALGQPGGTLASAPVSLKDNQDKDRLDQQGKEVPAYIRSMNRVLGPNESKGSYAKVWGALIAIIMIAVLSTGMRISHLEKVQIEETAGMGSVGAQNGNPFDDLKPNADAKNNSNEALPSVVTDSQKVADEKAGKDKNNSVTTEGLFAFIMLAVIFLFTQLVSFISGMKYSFISESDGIEAYKSTGGFRTYEQYRSRFQPKIAKARTQLRKLQQSLKEKASSKLNLVHTFDDYLLDTQIQDRRTSGEIKTLSPHQEEIAPPLASPVEKASDLDLFTTNPIESHIRAIDALIDKQEKVKYLNLLPDLIQKELRTFFADRKEAERLQIEKAAKQSQQEEKDAELF